MKKITLLFLTILPILVFSQTTIESFSFDADAEGFVPGNTNDTSVNYDTSNYYSTSGAIEMGQLTVNKVIKKVGITTIDALGDYTLKFKIRGTETGANIKGNLRTTTNYAGVPLMMSSLPTSMGDDGATWYEYSTTITIATLNLTNSQIQIQTNTLGTYYIDDVEIIKEPLAGNALTVNIVGAGNVALTLNQTSYADTDVETLTANPSSHWNFDSWSGDLTGTTNPETLLMDTDKTVTATFTIDPTFDYDFTFDTDGDLEGWTMDPNVSVVSQTGGLVTLSVIENQWSRFNLFDFPIPAAAEGENDPARYNKVTITIQNQEPSTDQLAVTLGPNNNTITFPLLSQAAFQTFEVDLTEYVDWTGDIESFRIRVADGDNPTATGRPSVAHNVVIDDVIFSFDAALSTSDVSLDAFAMYPNPAKNVLNIESSTAITNVDIYDITGKQVLTTTGFLNSTQLNISSLNSGLYLVKLTAENNSTVIKKLIIN